MKSKDENNPQNRIHVEDIEVSKDIFRSYDIRGVADQEFLAHDDKRGLDLTARQAWLIGKAFGTWIIKRNGRKVVVGRDNRRTSLDSLLVLSLECYQQDVK